MIADPPAASSAPNHTELRVERALFHPLWLFALATLAVNDHVLKQLEAVPRSLSGKLSDFAGLIVAPVVLGALLRVRTTRALAACSVAIGAVFALLQLSPAFASGWDGAVGTFGVGWSTYSDPTDLVALPSLLVPHLVLVPAMRRRAAALPWGRALRGGLFATALLLCMATSPVEPPLSAEVACHDDYGNSGPCDEELCWDAYGSAAYCHLAQCGTAQWYDTEPCPEQRSAEERCLERSGELVNGQCVPACDGVRSSAGECVFRFDDVGLFVYNESPETALVRVLELAPGVLLDCAAVAEDPDRHLKRALFEAAGSWVLEPGQLRPVGTGSAGRNCGAVVLGAGAVRDQVVFWSGPSRLSVWAEPDPGRLASRQGVTLSGSAEEPVFTALADNVQVMPLTPALRAAETAPICRTEPDYRRLEWSGEPSVGRDLRVDALDESPDGCLGLTLTPVDEPWLARERVFLCLDATRLPVAVGDVIRRAEPLDPGGLALERRPRPSEGEAATNALVHLLRQPSAAVLAELGVAVEPLPWPECRAEADPECGTVTQVAALVVTELASDETVVLDPGDSLVVARPDGGWLTLELLRSQVRPVVATACSAGPDALGADVELIAVEYTPASPTGDGENP